jgi:hypothetical protein
MLYQLFLDQEKPGKIPLLSWRVIEGPQIIVAE